MLSIAESIYWGLAIGVPNVYIVNYCGDRKMLPTA